MSNTDIECLIAGAGVVGLAIGRALAREGKEVIICEAGPAIGQGISSRNSEVIHAGIYYPPGSLKAQFCVAGKRLLYAYCDDHKVEHRRCEKIIVATSEEQKDRLSAIAARAAQNGVDDLRLLDRAELTAMEPALSGVAGLLSPSTGIIDTHGLMLALQGDMESDGGALALNTGVLSAREADGAVEIETGGAEPATLTARHVINATGLNAPVLAQRCPGLDPASVPRPYFAKGNYFSMTRRAPFSRLIYPVPEPGGLGVHLTLDLQGQARFGPDVEWLDVQAPESIDYRVDPARADKFYAAIRSYWPDLRDGELQADYSGVRPKIVAPGKVDADFSIRDHAKDGVPGLIGLYGIESPGLTSSLAIADHVARLVSAR